MRGIIRRSAEPPCDRRESHHDDPIRAGREPAPPPPVSRHSRHGRQPHQHLSARPARPGTSAAGRAPAQADAPVAAPVEVEPPQPVRAAAAPLARDSADAEAATPSVQPAPQPAPQPVHEPAHGQVAAAGSDADRDAPPAGQDVYRPTCTQAQLRRFIKSRPWIPMHELRRRFGIDGGDDDVSPIRVGDHTLFIGLPPSEGRMIAELLGSDVGYELSLDPCTPVVIGVYPLRPVPRS